MTRIIDQIITDQSNILTLDGGNLDTTTPTTLHINTRTGDRATLKLRRIDYDQDLAAPDLVYGRVVFEKEDKNGHGGASILVAGSNFLLLGNRKNTVGHFFPEEGCFVIKDNNNFGVGTKKPSKNARLDINGIAKLRVQTQAPPEGEAGMIAVVSGKEDEWDPCGKKSETPYIVFHDGNKWREVILGD